MFFSNQVTRTVTTFFLSVTLAFFTTAAVAETGGPTVTFSEDTETPQLRNAFKVKITFSHVVTGFDETDIIFKGGVAVGKSLTDYNPINAAALVPSTETEEEDKVWTATINIHGNDLNFQNSVLVVEIVPDAAKGNSSENLSTTQPGNHTFDNLPPHNPGWFVTATLDDTTLDEATEITDDGKLMAGAMFTVDFEYTTGPLSVIAPDLQQRAIQINGKTANENVNPTVDGILGLVNTPATLVGAKASVEFTVDAADAEPVTIGISPNFADGNTITVPTQAGAPGQLPTVTLTLVQNTLDENEKTFLLRLDFSEPVPTLIEDDLVFFEADADGMKTAVIAVGIIEDLDPAQGGLIWIAEVSYKAAPLPLFVTVADDVVSAMTPTDGLIVESQTPPQPQPPPITTITFTPPSIDAQLFTENTPIMTLDLPIATGGTPPYDYILTPVPEGLTFEVVADVPQLSGTPTIPQAAADTTYTVTDSAAPMNSASLIFSITIEDAAPLSFAPKTIAHQTFKHWASISFSLPKATGGAPPYDYDLAPVPQGLIFDDNPDHPRLANRPTTLGITYVTYTVTDTENAKDVIYFTITVNETGIPGPDPPPDPPDPPVEPPVEPPTDTPADIEDTTLAGAIRSTLGLTADTELTAAHLFELTTLDAYNKGITTLNGLEPASNLKVLDLGANQLSNIEPLASLTQLTHLYLDGNNISKVKPLEGLSNLQLLRLAGNPINDKSPLVALLQQNPHVDIDIPVSAPPQATGVTFADANLELAVRDALGLGEGGAITSADMQTLVMLEAYDRRIEEIDGLEEATNLIVLDLGMNEIVDIGPLAGLTQLEILYLDGNEIENVSPLAGLTKLTTLFLQGNPITDLSPISHLIGGIRVFRLHDED